MASTSRHRSPSDNSPFSIESMPAAEQPQPTASIGALARHPPPQDPLALGLRGFNAAASASGGYPSHGEQPQVQVQAPAQSQQQPPPLSGSLSVGVGVQLPNLLFPNGTHPAYTSASPVSPHAFPSGTAEGTHIFPPATFDSSFLPPKTNMSSHTHTHSPRHHHHIPPPSSPFSAVHAAAQLAPAVDQGNNNAMVAMLGGLGGRAAAETLSRKRTREDASATTPSFDFDIVRTPPTAVNTMTRGGGGHSFPHPPPPPPPAQAFRSLSTGLHSEVDPGVETIGVKYKTPVESWPKVRAMIEHHESKLASSPSLKWYLQETERRIQKTPGLAGDMWQGPGGTAPNIKYRYPRGDEDVEMMLDDASVLEDSWYTELRKALAAQLEEIRQTAIQTEGLMERRLDRQRQFRSIPVEEVDRRMEYVRAKFLKCRQAVLEKFKTYVRALKWVHLSPQRQRRGSYTREQNNVLRLWLFQHFTDPYPSATEKQDLMHKCQMNDTQISNWMINSRVRIWKPCLNAVSQSQAAQETVRQLEEMRARKKIQEQQGKRPRLQGGGGRGGGASGSSSGVGVGSAAARSGAGDGGGRRPW